MIMCFKTIVTDKKRRTANLCIWRKKLRQQTEHKIQQTQCVKQKRMLKNKNKKNYEKKVPIIVCMTALFDNNWCTMCTFCGCWLLVSCGFSLFAAHSHITCAHSTHTHTMFMLIILFGDLKDYYLSLLFSRLKFCQFVRYSLCHDHISEYSHFTDEYYASLDPYNFF